MKTQYTPKNWPVDKPCECLTCQAACGYQMCDGDCQPNCDPSYDCETRVEVETTDCGRIK
jgi:hypothetical protein